MNSNKIIWLGLFVGSFLGGSIPLLWQASVFSFSSIVFSALGGFCGIWFCYKLTKV